MALRGPATGLELLALKDRVGERRAKPVLLPVFIHLDACHRGQGTTNAANQITKCLVMTMVLSSLINKRDLYDIGALAYTMLDRACRRPDPVAFTTTEYKSIREAIAVFAKVLPKIQLKDMIGAHQHVIKVLQLSEDEPLFVD